MQETMSVFEKDQRGEEQYHPLSLTSVVSLVVGLLSCLALAHPILYVVPVIAIVLSLVAIHRIRSADGEVTGHNFAVIGLALACLFGSWALAYELTSRKLLSEQARWVVDQWITYVQNGELQQAHQLMLRPQDRAPRDVSLANHYLGNIKFRQAFQRVFAAEPAKAIAAAGMKSEIRFHKTIEILKDTANSAVNQEYTFKDPNSNGRRHSFELLIVRSESQQGPGGWYISGVHESGH